MTVALYIATGDEGAALILANLTRAFAEARDWTVALARADGNPTHPLGQWPGWQAIADALNTRAIHGVVTWTYDMVSTSQAVRGIGAHERLPTVLDDRGGFLVTAHPVPYSTTADHGNRHPPRRTSADLARRRALADAAAGFAVFRFSFGGNPRTA
ncbi:hypothetical protein AB0E96_05955 [Kitasatospora sp. NPDC036755]|uniref:hypothetical protein n=1 Tax=Kitasatospora sp. NPDC036755 TaxID=3154600 RepID=UPI00340686DA